jgi:hypothetical protein
MEDAQAKPVANEGRTGLTGHRVNDGPVGLTVHDDAHGEWCSIEGAAAGVGDREGVAGVGDLLPGNVPRPCGPVSILKHDVDTPQDLNTTESDAAQVAVGVVD